MTFVANQRLRLPNSNFIHLIQVGFGPDIADDEISNQCEAGDLIITADIPLAARIVEKGAHALDPRGTIYDKNKYWANTGYTQFHGHLARERRRNPVALTVLASGSGSSSQMSWISL